MADDAYRTHTPVLAGLGALFRIHTVWELGAGRYSTPLFMDRDAFPYLNTLTTFEHDPEWIVEVENLLPFVDRDRLRIVGCPYGVAAGFETFIKAKMDALPDLIFIDCGISEEDRLCAMVAVEKALDGTHTELVVVHDAEVSGYSQWLLQFDNCVTFDHVSPHTAVVWNGGADEDRRFTKLKQLKRVLDLCAF